jgi:hypothetical protein
MDRSKGTQGIAILSESNNRKDEFVCRRSRGALLFRPRIVLGVGISDAPPRSRAHADWPAHLGSDRRPAADFQHVAKPAA